VRCRDQNAGIVARDVDLAESCQDCLDRRLGAFQNRDIGGNGACLDAVGGGDVYNEEFIRPV